MSEPLLIFASVVGKANRQLVDVMSAMKEEDDLDWTVDVPRPVRLGVDPSKGDATMDIENIIFQALVNEGKHLKVGHPSN